MNKKYRHHPMFLVENAKSSIGVAIIIGFYVFSSGDDDFILFGLNSFISKLIVSFIVGILIVIISLAVSVFLYYKSYYEITDDRVIILRKTIFSYKKKEVYFNNLSTFDVTNYFYYKFFDVNKVILDTASVVTAKKDDLVIYINDNRLDELRKYYNSFKGENQVQEEIIDEQPNTTVDIRQVRKYKLTDLFIHMFFSSLDNLIISLIIFIIVILVVVYFELYWIIVLSLFSIILYLLQFVYLIVRKNMDLYDFTISANDFRALISKGLIKTTNITFEFKNIKALELVRNRIIKRSYINVDVIGLSNVTNKDDSLITLFDKDVFINQVADSLQFNKREFRAINKNYKAFIMNTFIYILISLLISCFLYYATYKFIPIYALAITVLVFMLLMLSIILRILRYTIFTKFYANDHEIKLQSGFINQKQLIFKKDNLQEIKVTNNIINKLFNTSSITFTSYKIESKVKNIIKFTHIEKEDIAYFLK